MGRSNGSYRAPRHRQLPPREAYPFVHGEPDEDAAYDAYSSLNDLLDYRARQFPDSPCLGETDIAAGVLHMYNFDQVRRLVISFAAAYLSTGLIKPRSGVTDRRTVICVMGAGADLWITTLALQRIGAIPLLVSWRLSPQAISHLITSAKADVLLLDPGSEELLSKMTDHLPAGLTTPPRLPWQAHLDPVHKDGSARLSASEIQLASDRVSSLLSLDERAQSIGIIFHTSGSTDTAKLVPASNTALLAAVCRSYRPTASAVLFATHHAAGFWGCSSMLAFAKLKIIVPVLSSVEDHLRAFHLCVPHVQTVYSHPINIQILISRPEGLTLLRGLQKIALAGGHFDQATFHQVANCDVEVWRIMGLTETMVALDSAREPPKVFSEWYKMPSRDLGGGFIRFVPWEADDLYELVVLDGYPTLHVCNTPEGYATGDLYIRHPREDKWMFARRRTSYLEHTNGKRTDPLPAELHLTASPLIKQALIIGEGRPDTAALVIPSTDVYDPYDMRSLFDQLNALIPEHSRIRPDRMAVLKASDEFDQTWKGEVIRHATMAKYQHIIDSLYQS